MSDEDAEQCRFGSETGSEVAPPLLVTTVDIGDGQTDLIELHDGDSPEDAAAAFCTRHGLPAHVIGHLTAHIADNLARAMSGLPSPSASHTGDAADAASKCSGGDTLEAAEAALEAANEYAAVDSAGWEDYIDGSGFQPLPEAAARPATGRTYTAPGRSSSAADSARSAPVAEEAAQEADDAAGAAHYEQPQEEELLWRENMSAMNGAGMGGTRREAYNRLYAHGREREARLDLERRLRDNAAKEMQGSYKLAISARSHQLAAGRTGRGEYRNHGERMYVEGVLEQRRKAQLVEEAAAEREAAELSEVTLKPKISAMARNLPRESAAWQRLTRTRTEKTQERLASLQQEKEEAAVADCTFRPAINRRSERLMSDRSSVLREHRISAHDQLFQDATRRAMRASEYEYWYPQEVTFAPRINPPKGKLASAQLGPVQDRLYKVAKQRADTLAAKRNAQPVDPHTRQPLFKPATGRAPAHARNRAAIPVGDYLYNIRKEHADKKDVLNALSERQRTADAATPFTTTVSKTMVGKLKAKRFRQIFEYLDVEAAGSLDLVTLAFGDDAELMDSLDGEVRADVAAAARLLSKRLAARQLDENTAPGGSAAPVTVDLPGFAGLMEDVLTKQPHPRAYLLPSQAVRKKWEEPTFQPKTCARSGALAAKRRPADQRRTDIMYATAAVFEERRQSRQAAALASQMQECTFQPEFVASKHRRNTSGDAASCASTPAAQNPAARRARAAQNPDAAYTSAGAAASEQPPQRPATAGSSATHQTPSAASIPASTASAAHRNMDHAKYTSLDAQIWATLAETEALTGAVPSKAAPHNRQGVAAALEGLLA